MDDQAFPDFRYSRNRARCCNELIPCSVAQGVLRQDHDFSGRFAPTNLAAAEILENSLYFSLLAGSFTLQTGSDDTGSSATHSRFSRLTVIFAESPAFPGLFRGPVVSETGQVAKSQSLRRVFGPRLRSRFANVRESLGCGYRDRFDSGRDRFAPRPKRVERRLTRRRRSWAVRIEVAMRSSQWGASICSCADHE
jgi:hypothetical protein